MAATRELTLEELQAELEKTKKNFDRLNELVKNKQQKEKEIREAKLAAEKEARQKEVQDALDNYHKLLREFIRDYGNIEIHNKSDYLTPLIPSNPFKWWF